MKNIKALREKLKMSQKDLARELNVGRSTVATWERGQAMPRTGMLKALADALHCKIDNLF